MHRNTSQPKLPEEEPKPLTIEIAVTAQWQKEMPSVERGANIIFGAITDALAKKKGLLIGRHGTIELTAVLQHIHGGGKTFDSDRAAILERNAGIFPATAAAMDAWCLEYLAATASADVLALAWYKPLARAEWNMVETLNSGCSKIPLRSLEPYYTEPRHSWTRVLEGRRVCVVNSFATTMESQLYNKNNIWPISCETLLPNAEWSFVRSYYSPVTAMGKCEWPLGIVSWKDAVQSLETEVMTKQPQIVLIGCGGLAMPLARRLKERGLICIVMGGAIQVLFGIMGRRWANHDVIRSFWNGAWVQPAPFEIPGAAASVEGGCYW